MSEEAVKNEGASGIDQYSEEFKSNMSSAQNALSGVGEGDNTYDSGNPTEAFRFEEVSTEGNNGVENPGGEKPAENQEGQEAPKGEVEGVEANPIVAENGANGSQEQVAEGEGESDGFTSRITGEVKLESEKIEGGESPAIESFENWEDFDKWSKEGEIGITKENIKQELPKLIEDRASLKAVSEQNGDYKAMFEKMPEDIVSSIKAWGNGEDWRAPIKNSDPTDFNLDFTKQGAKEMVERYYPGKITAEDWEEFSDKDSGDETVKEKVTGFVELAEGKYGLDQQTFKQQTQDYKINAERATALRQEAFDQSRVNIANAFEGTSLTIDDSYIAEVDKVAQNQQGVLGLFYNQDGTLKEDAHQRIAMAMDGRDLVVQQAKQMEKRIVSKARQEVVSVTPDSHSIKNTGDQGKKTELEASKEKMTKHVDSILGNQEEKTY